MAEEKHKPTTDDQDNDRKRRSDEDEALTEDELNDITGGQRGSFCRESGPIFIRQAGPA